MLKKTAFLLLTVSLVFLGRESFTTWRESYKIPTSLKEVRKIPGGSSVQKVNFYPPPPATPPDLTENYVFNSERSLAAKANGNETAGGEGSAAGPSTEIEMKDLIYNGSIIRGDKRKALVSYEEIVKVTQASPFPGRMARVQEKREQKHALLGISDKLGEYQVSAVEPDRIILQKDNESIVKMLYEKNLNRTILPGEQPGQREKRDEGNTPQAKGRNPLVISKKPDPKNPEEARPGSLQRRIPFRGRTDSHQHD